MPGAVDDNVFAATADADRVDYERSIKNAHIEKTLEEIEAKPDATKQDYYVSERTLDESHDGEVPNDNEKVSLRRVPGAIPWRAFFIALVELAERFSYYGCTAVFTNFIQQPLPAGSRTGAGHSGQSGALGQGQQASTGLTTFNSFWVYTTPLFGAWIADTYWGRFKTISWSVAVAMVGHILLIISAIPTVLDKPHSALGVFSLAIVIMGVGTGGFKPNISNLIAEQSHDQIATVKTLKSGERVIVDPSLTASRLFMYFYLMINIGAIGGQIGMVYCEKYVGFWLAYLLPTIVFFLCPIVLLIGKNRYVKLPPKGSAISSGLHMIGFAMKGRWFRPKLWMSNDFWERAKPSNVPVEQRPRWMRYDDAYVDEVARGIKACKVFAFYPLYWICYNQINNNLTSQAALMNTHGLPNDILNNLDPLAIVILIPIFDIAVYPLVRKCGIRVTPLRKIAAGFFTAALAMMCAAITQWAIYDQSACGYHVQSCEDEPYVPGLNVWIQTPSYVLIAVSEILASITGLEYAFTKAPKSMRSLVMAIFLFTSAIGSAINEAFNPLVSDPLLIYNYGAAGILACLSGIAFVFCFYKLDGEEEKLNDLAEGKVNVDADDNALSVEASSEKEKV